MNNKLYISTRIAGWSFNALWVLLGITNADFGAMTGFLMLSLVFATPILCILHLNKIKDNKAFPITQLVLSSMFIGGMIL